MGRSSQLKKKTFPEKISKARPRQQGQDSKAFPEENGLDAEFRAPFGIVSTTI